MVRVAGKRSRRALMEPAVLTVVTGTWTLQVYMQYRESVQRPNPRVLLIFPDAERQQHISRHAAEARVAGIDEDHAAGDHGAGSVERAALGRNAVDCREVARGVEVPQHFSVFGVEGAHAVLPRHSPGIGAVMAKNIGRFLARHDNLLAFWRAHQEAR